MSEGVLEHGRHTVVASLAPNGTPVVLREGEPMSLPAVVRELA